MKKKNNNLNFYLYFCEKRILTYITWQFSEEMDFGNMSRNRQEVLFKSYITNRCIVYIKMLHIQKRILKTKAKYKRTAHSAKKNKKHASLCFVSIDIRTNCFLASRFNLQPIIHLYSLPCSLFGFFFSNPQICMPIFFNLYFFAAIDRSFPFMQTQVDTCVVELRLFLCGK